MRKYVVEFIGTFFLVLTVGAAVLSDSRLAPLAIGGVLMVMVYAGGHVSGAHYNPAVTLAVLIRGRIAPVDAAWYTASQLVAALAAAPLARWAVNPPSVTALSLSGRHLASALVVEALFAFALAYVVLNVALSASHEDNSFYGLAIGFTVLAGAASVGGISGGAFNPAVALGGAAMGLFDWSDIWVYLIADLIGGAVAGAAFLFLNPLDGRAATEPAWDVAEPAAQS
ncbi:aquaporin [Streptomyces sp. V4-01]|uniref:Aquaporin n=1 Tax=Actinacidiphila polyblastidii TaxID=3110430 RepID=A0ABU7PPF8_9ACTN|nr:aquaporin [Streptomyces sp. V4-01]